MGIKKLNFNIKEASEKRLLQLNELEELRNDAYENSRIYKDRMKKWNYKNILRREFKIGDKDLLYNSRLKLFPGKLKSRWSSPYMTISNKPYGAIGVKSTLGEEFKVNGQ